MGVQVNKFAVYVAMNMFEGLTLEQAQQVAKIQADLFLNPRDLPMIPVEVKFSADCVAIGTEKRMVYYSASKSSPLIVNRLE